MSKLFNDLMKIYDDNSSEIKSNKKLLEKNLSKKDYSVVDSINTRTKCCEEFDLKLKHILKEHFKTDIETSVPELEKEYQKQCEYSKGAWDMYGSELAGDFNSGEIKALKKLNLYKGLLK